MDGVVRFTEPADALGQKVTEVTYAYRVTQVARWAEDTELRRAYPYLEAELASRGSPREATITFVQASDGWRVLALP